MGRNHENELSIDVPAERRSIRRGGKFLANGTAIVAGTALASQLFTASNFDADAQAIGANGSASTRVFSGAPLVPGSLFDDIDPRYRPKSVSAPTPTTEPAKQEPINSTCHEGEATSVSWEVMGIKDAPIEKIGIDPKTGGMAKTGSQYTWGIYEAPGSPKIGSREGNVLSGAERFGSGDSIFPANYEQRLAETAVGSVIQFTMADGGTCKYKIDTTFPTVAKHLPEEGGDPSTTAYAATINRYDLYRTTGSPGIFVEGCTGPWDAKHGTSYYMGIAVGHLMSDENP